MSKKVSLVKEGPSTSYSEVELQSTHWELCCLCQQDDGNPLLCPANNNDSKSNKCGYESLARNLIEFDRIGSVPMMIDLNRLDGGIGIMETLLQHKAVYHKTCYLKFNNKALERARKKVPDILVEPLPKKTQRVPDTSKDEPNIKCFFCDQVSDEKLHRASTTNIDKRVRECAERLCDIPLLAKLAMSDMHALDAYYHRSCLLALYNRARQHNDKPDSLCGSQSMSITAVVLAELASYIEELTHHDNTIPVFKLSDMVKLYANRLSQLGIEISSRINSTRLKERLLAIVPGLKAHTSGKEVLLTYDEDVGCVINTACESTFDSDAMVLAKAARIVRKGMFSQIKWSVSEGVQTAAVPDELLSLVRMILEGPNIQHQTSNKNGRNNAASVLSQLLIFNSVKFSTSDSSTVRHNIDRETPLPTYLGLMLHGTTRKRDLVDKLHALELSVSYGRVLQISSDLANAVWSALHT